MSAAAGRLFFNGSPLLRKELEWGFLKHQKRTFFASSPLQTFSANNKQFHPDGTDAGAPRPFQGMDMRKINRVSYISHKVDRVPMRSGYQYLNFTTPSVIAPTHADIATFFDTANFRDQYTTKEILKAAWPSLRFLIMAAMCVLVPATPIILFVFYMNMYEPMEHFMDADEYFKNFKWNYFGPELDHHAYAQYLEARRAKKWRNRDDIDVDAYIPSQYASK